MGEPTWLSRHGGHGPPSKGPRTPPGQRLQERIQGCPARRPALSRCARAYLTPQPGGRIRIHADLSCRPKPAGLEHRPQLRACLSAKRRQECHTALQPGPEDDGARSPRPGGCPAAQLLSRVPSHFPSSPTTPPPSHPLKRPSRATSLLPGPNRLCTSQPGLSRRARPPPTSPAPPKHQPGKNCPFFLLCVTTPGCTCHLAPGEK